jgi:hypothetical protein
MANRDLSLVDPELRRRLMLMMGDWNLAHAPQPRLMVVEAFRTKERQEQLYADYLQGGATATARGHSLHEYGYACDMGFCDDVAVRMDWAEVRFKLLGVLAERHGLVWGGRFPKPDLDHFQAPITWEGAAAGQKPAWPA